MTYATDVIQQYRIALRYLWNTHFWPDSSEEGWEDVKQFNNLKLPLFVALVLRRLDVRAADPTGIFGESFRVIPRVTHADTMAALHVDVGFDNRPGKCWTHVVGPFRPGDLRLTLLDFFDWEELNWRDFRYYRVRIDAFPARPESVGREGLVENLDADVVWDPPGIIGLPITLRAQDGDDNAPGH